MEITKLYKNWHMHNIVAHPVMHILDLIGLSEAATKVHDGTLPPEAPEE